VVFVAETGGMTLFSGVVFITDTGGIVLLIETGGVVFITETGGMISAADVVSSTSEWAPLPSEITMQGTIDGKNLLK